MHHVVLERWSRGDSPLHRRDARAKTLALLIFLVALGTTPAGLSWAYAGFAAIALTAALCARLPATRLAVRAAAVLPVAGVFAALAWMGGNRAIAASAPVKSFLSTFAVLTVVSATPLPAFLGALAWMRAPRSVLSVAQFIYRYVFVVSEQAQHMRAAAASRGGGFTFRGASAAVAVLFAKSYERAERIHHAMLARGFAGAFPKADAFRWRAADSALLTAAVAACLAARVIG